MKQKLTRALIDEIRKEMPVLTEMEMRCCNGGDGGTVSWDCLFNCMDAIDPSRSAQEYAKEYADRYNLDPNTMGGVPENYINDVLTTLGFNNVPTNSMTPSREYHQIVAIENHDGTAHAVILSSFMDENGNFFYYDPTTNTGGLQANKSDIVGIYRISRSDINNPENVDNSYVGDSTFGYNNSIYADYYTSDYNYNGSYNNYEYNRDDQNDYSNYNSSF